MLFNPNWRSEEPWNYRPRRHDPLPPVPQTTWWGIGISIGALVVGVALVAFTHAMNDISPHYASHLQKMHRVSAK